MRGGVLGAALSSYVGRSHHPTTPHVRAAVSPPPSGTRTRVRGIFFRDSRPHHSFLVGLLTRKNPRPAGGGQPCGWLSFAHPQGGFVKEVAGGVFRLAQRFPGH